MGRFLDFLRFEGPLPGVETEARHFITKDMGERMRHLTVRADGQLIHHTVRYESMTEEEMDAAGITNPVARISASLQEIPDGDELLDFTGTIRLFEGRGEGEPQYRARFQDGRLVSIEPIR